MKKIVFSLSQRNGNLVSFSMESLPEGITQDKFSGTYVFPAMLRLVKGSSKLFDKNLPVYLNFTAEVTEGEFINKAVANLRLKSKSVYAIRQAVLVFNEAIAGLVVPAVETSIYAIQDMKANKGREYRAYTSAMLRPSVPLANALSN